MNGRSVTSLPSSPGLAALTLRVVVGAVMLAHGLQKITGGVEAFAGFVASLGLPLPTLTAYAVVFVEAVGGGLLLVGLLTRLWGLLIALLMVGTTLTAKLDDGLIAAGEGVGAELDLVLLAGALAITMLGPGRASLDGLLGLERPSADRAGRVDGRRSEQDARVSVDSRAG